MVDMLSRILYDKTEDVGKTSLLLIENQYLILLNGWGFQITTNNDKDV